MDSKQKPSPGGTVMTAIIRRACTTTIVALATLVSAIGIGAEPAGAAAPPPAFPPTVILVIQKVDATTHIAKTNQDVVVPQGLFYGLVDLASGNILGVLVLPPSHVQTKAAGLIPVLDATSQIEPIGPIVGHIDFATLQSTTTSSFNIHIAKLTAGGTGVNLVGDQCRTSAPITLTMSGTVDLVRGSTFASRFDIPPFANCGAIGTTVLNQSIAGPGNTFRASFSPA